MKTNRIGVYFDGNYFFQVSNYYAYGHSRKKRLSLSGIHEFILAYVADLEGTQAGNCLIADAHYFRARPAASEASFRGDLLFWDRSFDDILSSCGITAHFIPVKAGQEGGRQDRRPDVWLALEAYQNTRFLGLDYVVLFVGDLDFQPLIAKLNSLGTKVILLAWDFEYINESNHRIFHRVPNELLQSANHAISMNEVLDNEDHSLASLAGNLFVAGESRKPFRREEETEQGEGKSGTILNLRNGFGFIKFPPNNVFFHYSNLVNCDFQDLQSGDPVYFDLEKNEEGQDVAKNVRLVGTLAMQ